MQSRTLSVDNIPSTSIHSRRITPPLFDWFFIITGGLLFALPFVLMMGEQRLARGDIIRWYFWMNALISSPHVYATYVRLQRKINEEKVSVHLGFPAYFLIVGLLYGASHFHYLIEAMTIINVWQSFHYLRQTYGVGCLYGHYNKIDNTMINLRYWAYHLPMPALMFGRWDTIYEAWGGKTYSFKPVHFNEHFMLVMWGIAAVGILIGLYGEYRNFRRNDSAYNPVTLINYLVFFGIHAYGFVVLSHFQRGFFSVTIFHAVQYLALVWILERKTAIEKGGSWYPKLPNILGFAAFWSILFILGYGYEQKVTVALNNYWIEASTILLASVSAHHYFVDAFIWRKKTGP